MGGSQGANPIGKVLDIVKENANFDSKRFSSFSLRNTQ